MLTFKNNKLRSWAQMLGACVLVATLSACGGGDDDVAGGGGGGGGGGGTGTPAITLPAMNPSSGYTQAGNLNYLVTIADGTTRTVAATVAFSTPNGTLTLSPGTPDALTVTTANAWGNVSWPVGVSGAVRADGNAGLVCRGAAGEVGMSHNMTRVTDLTVLHGRSFRFTECTGTGVATGSWLLTFNANGTATIDAGTPSPELISSAEVTAVFSVAGWTEGTAPDTSNFKLRLYAHTAGGVTQYHIAEIGDEFSTGQSRFRYVGLWSPAP